MWVYCSASAEVIALEVIEVGSVISWSCRSGAVGRLRASWPIDVDPGSLLIEDSDYAFGMDDELVEVVGTIRALRVHLPRTPIDGRRSQSPTPERDGWLDVSALPEPGMWGRRPITGVLVLVAPTLS